MPSVERKSLLGWFPIDPMLHGLAHMFVRDLVEAMGSNELPQLKVIGLGALAYRDVWDGRVVEGSNDVDDFLRLRVYEIEYMKNKRGEQVPMLTMVANGYPGNVGPDISENMSIFEPYWLG